MAASEWMRGRLGTEVRGFPRSFMWTLNGAQDFSPPGFTSFLKGTFSLIFAEDVVREFVWEE
jgi:hypothetical protein